MSCNLLHVPNFNSQPLLAQSRSFISILFVVAADLMARSGDLVPPGTWLPPSQFNLTVTFGSEEIIPVERLLKAFALEHLTMDRNQIFLPLKLPKNLHLAPTVEQYWEYKTDLESLLDEDAEYWVLLPDPVYTRVWDHCGKAFPSRIVSFNTPGRVVGVDLTLKPISMVDVLYRFWTQMHELDGARLRIAALERSSEMVNHNLAVLTKTLVAVNPALVDELHPDTPPSWTTIPEEY